MEIIKMPIGDIKPYPNNPRRNDDAVAAVMESIKQCGYCAPIVVDEDGVVLAGHTRLKALKKLGRTEAEVCVKTGMTEEQKKNVRRMLPLTSEKYRKQHEQMEALKHINEIRKKLGAIDAFLAKKKEIYAKMAEVEAERKKLYGKEPEWVEVWVMWNRGDE